MKLVRFVILAQKDLGHPNPQNEINKIKCIEQNVKKIKDKEIH